MLKGDGGNLRIITYHYLPKANLHFRITNVISCLLRMETTHVNKKPKMCLKILNQETFPRYRYVSCRQQNYKPDCVITFHNLPLLLLLTKKNIFNKNLWWRGGEVKKKIRIADRCVCVIYTLHRP